MPDPLVVLGITSHPNFTRILLTALDEDTRVQQREAHLFRLEVGVRKGRGWSDAVLLQREHNLQSGIRTLCPTTPATINEMR